MAATASAGTSGMPAAAAHRDKADPKGKPDVAGQPHVMRPPKHPRRAMEEATLRPPDNVGPCIQPEERGGPDRSGGIPHLLGRLVPGQSGRHEPALLLLQGIGGSVWGNVPTQYQQGCAPGTYSCTGAHAGNPAAPVKGWYEDTGFVPTTPTQSQVELETPAPRCRTSPTTQAATRIP